MVRSFAIEKPDFCDEKSIAWPEFGVKQAISKLEKQYNLCYDVHYVRKGRVYPWKGMAIIMYKCCIFDLDGTLVNSIYAIQRSVNETLEIWNMRSVSVEECRRYVGDGYKKLLERALAACGDSELIHYEEAVDRYQEIFRGCCMYRVEAYQGIEQLLRFLREQGICTAVLSNKPHLRTVENVEGVFGKGYFDFVYGEREDKGIRKKPAPDGVLALMEEAGVSREEILYLGDTNTDMETGRNAGVDTVGAAWGFRPREELESYSPLLVADRPEQIVRLIKDVNRIE